MSDSTIIGATGRIDNAAIDKFETGLRGLLLRPGSDAYEGARKLWNGMIDRKPALIARCAGTADIISSVSFAREHGLQVAVRGGGHSFPGHSTCDGGLVIDLSTMKGIRVDSAARLVRAQPGVKWIDFDHETQTFGLATSGGTVSDTGIAGLTLGGGLGFLSSKHGLTIDNLVSADIVTADGRLLTANAGEHPDLFWGLRGGGGNFGIVTSFEYRLHSVGPTVFGGMIAYPLSRARDVLRFYNDFTKTAPDELTTYAGFLTPPGGDTVVALICCYCGPLDKGEAVTRPFRSLATPVHDALGPLPYVMQQQIFDAGFPTGSYYYSKADSLTDLDAEVIDILIEYASNKPSSLSGIAIQTVFGAASRVASDATAFPHRTFPFAPIIVSQWLDPAQTAENVAWARDCWGALHPFAGGVYVNDLGENDEERIPAAYGTNYQRLAALKKKYDPDNCFHLNPNIKPID